MNSHMKVSLLLLVASSAFAVEAMKPDVAEPPFSQAVTELAVEPARVALDGPFESAQVIITAKLASGDSADATRFASVKVSNGIAGITPAGRLTPIQNGKGHLDVELGSKHTSIPITVAGIGVIPKVDFIRDVNPVMTKVGCNAGTCHGAKEGKVGFKLSLRGYDPLFDVRSLKDDLAGRRLNAAAPDDSLMLLKATAGVPHEGGQKFKVGDPYYELLRAWIADGAKLDLSAQRVTKIDVSPRNPVVQQLGGRQQFRVVATYSDGRTRDVTAEAFVESGNTDVAAVVPESNGLIKTLRRGEAPVLARYEGNYLATTLTVMGDRTGFTWQEPEKWSRIDELVAAKWQRMKIQPSDLCSDADFLRRVHLDLTGLPPTAEELRAFLADTAPPRQKRDAVVDRLIGSPDFVEHWTNRWASLLQVNSKFLGGEGATKFREWIKGQVAANTPYNVFAKEILTASGSNRENPAASYWKILREPAEAMENTTHLFLATRFNCNKCHDHPFERWTQDQYYHLGAYFSQVGYETDPVSGKAVIQGTAVEKSRPLWEIVADKKDGEMLHDRTHKVAAPEFPFVAKVGDAVPTPETAGTRRKALADWVTSTDNRYFASSYVNRLWGYLTGAGIIEPLDDIRAGNPPSNPELLDYLKREFVEHNFDVQHVLRLIAKSRTYQLAVSTNRWNEDDKTNYSHALARRLPAEVLYDSVLAVTGSAPRLPGGARATMLADAQSDLPSGFLANLGRPTRESACECERSSDLRLGSVMALLSGPAIADAIGDPNSGLVKLVASQLDDAKLIDDVFLRVLSRQPSEIEVKATLSEWNTLTAEHSALLAEWDAKEKEQAPVIAKMEADRVIAIEDAKKELARYETEIAPKVAEAEKKRQADIAAADASVKTYETQKLAAAQANFEATVPANRTYAGWHLLDFAEARATNGVEIKKQPDGSWKAEGARPGTSDYVLKADTKLAGVTGLLLEVLPSADEPAFGPGRFSDGNFVLGELSIKTGAFGAATGDADAPLDDAIADFSQQNFEVKKAIDGKRGDGNNGWAVSNQFGVAHFAAFKFGKPLNADGAGVRLRIEMNQPRPGGFTISRIRVWVTNSATPLFIGLPATVAEAIKKPASARSPEEQSAITAYWNDQDPELRKLRLAFGKLQLPLPIDPGIIQRREAIAKAELPIRLDPKLVQLRADAEQSKSQIANKRLTGAQDLVWALVNTPAFLFNR